MIEVMPMSAFQDAFNAMTAAGMPPSLVADLLSAVLLEGAARVTKQPSSSAVRSKRYRERRKALQSVTRDGPVTKSVTCDGFVTESVTKACRVTPPPLQTPIKNLPSEEVSKVVRFAAAGPEEKPEGFGYSSSDGSVSFTAAEITRLGLECYSLTNVYGMIRSISESSWMDTMRPTDRKRAVMNKIRKTHAGRVRNNAPSPEEHQQAVKQSIELRQDEQERARQARARVLGGRRVG